MRENADLDSVFFNAEPATSPRLPKERRKKPAPGKRDVIRRRAFRALAMLADLGSSDRLAVLQAAERVNRA
jgi:hypothetical protein